MKTTFLELSEEFCDKEKSRFHIVPVPYEGTVCFASGTVHGPEAILNVSDQIEHFDEETFCEFYRAGIYTHSTIEPATTPELEMEKIEDYIDRNQLFRPDRFPIFLGGEHSISAPIVRQAIRRYPDLSVLQFDAHSDLRNTFSPGGKFSHACVMRRILETNAELVQVGIRSFSQADLIECPKQVDHFITPAKLEDNWAGSLQSILDRLTQNVYITFDMDALDLSIAPGVGTPEPGGLSWRQTNQILREVCCSKNIIGADVVETLPQPHSNITEFTAVRLIAKMMTWTTQKANFRQSSR
ncbi:MAG: agmatinase [Planctomycetia bacterium]|nr:agmatinase [Planctomycetia bacterium]